MPPFIPKELLDALDAVAEKHGIEGELKFVPDPRFPFTPRDNNDNPLPQSFVSDREDD
jgi:hypothetical protein